MKLKLWGYLIILVAIIFVSICMFKKEGFLGNTPNPVPLNINCDNYKNPNTLSSVIPEHCKRQFLSEIVDAETEKEKALNNKIQAEIEWLQQHNSFEKEIKEKTELLHFMANAHNDALNDKENKLQTLNDELAQRDEQYKKEIAAKNAEIVRKISEKNKPKQYKPPENYVKPNTMINRFENAFNAVIDMAVKMSLEPDIYKKLLTEIYNKYVETDFFKNSTDREKYLLYTFAASTPNVTSSIFTPESICKLENNIFKFLPKKSFEELNERAQKECGKQYTYSGPYFPTYEKKTDCPINHWGENPNCTPCSQGEITLEKLINKDTKIATSGNNDVAPFDIYINHTGAKNKSDCKVKSDYMTQDNIIYFKTT
tara:strand:- start:11042 stop:12151 length:1110 start_codon:yes stop_codon:yes gene_type:complete